MKATVPSSTQPISSGGGLVTTVWQRFFNALVTAPAAIESVPATGSPLTYTASQTGSLSVVGGTVTAVSMVRARVTVDLTGAAMVPMANEDVVTITYSVAPVISFIPS